MTLKAIGVVDAFTGRADLTGMSPEAGQGGLQVWHMIHKATIDVDELCTTAAAATANLAQPVSAPVTFPGCPKAVAVDRPFVCVILKSTNHEVLFAGRVDDRR